VAGRVEGPVEIEVPAGKFRCLVCVEECERDGERWTQKCWVAPRVGRVKLLLRFGQDYTLSLAGIERPSRVAPEGGAAVLGRFDFGDPLVVPAFPKARWSALAGDARTLSACEIDPFDGAADTAFSLRWAYQFHDAWAHVGIVPSGTWGEPVDFSAYRAISFHAKALSERQCNFVLSTAPWGDNGPVDKNIPLQLTTEWQRLEFDLRQHPQLRGADLTKVYGIRFGDYDKGHAANVIWIDQVLLHPPKAR
jgi:hypothetical protein